MTHKTQESTVAQRDGRCVWLRWFAANGQDDMTELELSPDELRPADLEGADAAAGSNGRPESKKWVLLH